MPVGNDWLQCDATRKKENINQNKIQMALMLLTLN
jgi:hypothetical protein